MKLKSLFIIAIASVLIGCNGEPDTQPEPPQPPKEQKDPYLKVTAKSMFIRGQRDAHVFDMYCNRPWRVVIPAKDTSWIRVEPSGGSGGEGLIGMKVYFGDNIVDSLDRHSEIKIEQLAPHTLTHSITIDQQSDYHIYRDSLALVEFYYAMGGPNWKVKWDLTKTLGKWGQAVQVSLGESWDGVWLGRFNGHRRVICIWYWNPNGLVGELPECLGRLTKLQGIGFVGDKGITGQLPLKALAKCNMDRITVVGCGISGSLSKDFNAMPKLDVVELGGNNITSIEDGFGDLPVLQGLMLGGNQIEGPLKSEWFSKMPNLVLLDLSHNNFTGEVPIDIGFEKKNLQHYRIDGNRFNGYFPGILKLEPYFVPDYFCPQQDGFGFAPGSCD